LQVRSFIDLKIPGTLIHSGAEYDTSIPSFIFKFDQVLVSVSTRDLSFITRRYSMTFSPCYRVFSIHMNIIQNSALTLTFCIDDHRHFQDLIRELQENYAVRYNQGLELITIRHSMKRPQSLSYKGNKYCWNSITGPLFNMWSGRDGNSGKSSYFYTFEQ